jgi:hypothetical protein
MRTLASKLAIAALPLLALACQKPDVGEPCTVQWGTGAPPTPQTVAGDYFESGNSSCDNLVCIVSPTSSSRFTSSCNQSNGTNCGYCSKPCVSNQDCYNSETGLVCDLVLPDPQFLATLDQTVRERYLADIAYSSYCVVPRSSK